MKKNLMVALAVVAVMFACVLSARAMDTGLMKVNIPFAFQVGQASLPAGEYVIEIARASNASALGTALVVRTWDGKTHQLVNARTAHRGHNQASVIFNKYSNTYFLAGAESFGLGCEVSKTKAEKEIAAKARAFEAVSVAAE